MASDLNLEAVIGFEGSILIEPKPQEPTKHQYDYDSATVYGFLQHYGLEDEIKVNIEVNHATLSGHDLTTKSSRPSPTASLVPSMPTVAMTALGGTPTSFRTRSKK